MRGFRRKAPTPQPTIDHGAVWAEEARIRRERWADVKADYIAGEVDTDRYYHEAQRFWADEPFVGFQSAIALMVIDILPPLVTRLKADA